MARMIPDVIPDIEGQSRAERLLYDELRRQLPDDYIVFYGVRFLADRHRSYSTDREIDFLIIHPERTGVVAEVKGGGIRYNPDYDTWASMDRNGNLHQIKNPFEQARKNLYDLLEELGIDSRTRGYRYSYNWQVILPDVSGVRDQLGMAAPAETVLDSTDLNDLQAAVERAARPLPEQNRLSTQAIRALIDAVAPTVHAPADGLGYHLLTTEQNLIRLTETQTNLLDFLENHPRAGIAGCCGSGKTMLALEKTRRLAARGKRVLLTCFNAHLADWLREQLEREGLELGDQVECRHYHGLVRDICERTGVKIPPEPVDRHEHDAYYEEVFPDCFDRAIAHLAPEDRYDAVIVDEGQDFSELWWSTLDAIHREPATGILYIFYDNNQRIYGHTGEMPVPDIPFPLTRNCRNTDQIHELVRPYYQGENAFQPGGVDGRDPEFVPVQSQDGVSELRSVLHRLLNVERVPTSDITILSPVRSRSALEDGMKVGNYTLRRTNNDLASGEVRWNTIHSFKGLESPIVIMTELDKLPERDLERRQGLLYVGLSRARSHLIVLGEIPEAVVSHE